MLKSGDQSKFYLDLTDPIYCDANQTVTTLPLPWDLIGHLAAFPSHPGSVKHWSQHSTDLALPAGHKEGLLEFPGKRHSQSIIRCAEHPSCVHTLAISSSNPEPETWVVIAHQPAREKC